MIVCRVRTRVTIHEIRQMIINKHPNRHLYNTATHACVTLDDLAELIREGTEFAVHEFKSGKDITRSVLSQIVLERESKATQNLLPISFLRQLIRFYGITCKHWCPFSSKYPWARLSGSRRR